MRFLAIGTALESPPVAAPTAIAAYTATFAALAAGEDPRIAAVYPYIGRRATAFVIDAASAEELGDVLAALPGYMLSTWEVHPVAGPAYVAEQLRRIGEALAGAS